MLNQKFMPLRYLHDCSDCFRLERLPGGIFTHWKAPPLHGAHPERTSDLSSATDRAGDALGQCEIPLGPKNWLVRLNHQRGVQLGHSSYKFTAVAPSDHPKSKNKTWESPDFRPPIFFKFFSLL